jgi:ATP-dependent DNA helicase RecG
LIKKNPQITVPEMAMNLGVTESAVEKQIRKLREQEIIGRIGPAKGGHWEILK